MDSPTNLSPTNLSPTNLSPTNLSPTNLSPTNLSPTNLSPTNLSPTDLGQLDLGQLDLGQLDDRLSLPTLFRISPLIRLTLLLLYGALTLPLPFLAAKTAAPVSPQGLAWALGVGAVLLVGALAEEVTLTEQGIGVAYPGWIRWLYRRDWFLDWAAIDRLQPRSTGQGGLVYYFVTREGAGYLLPMRIAGFNRLVQIVQARTEIDTTDVKPLAQPWMYLVLLVLTSLLLLVDLWVILVAAQGV
jgi:hypothetical protein